MKISRGPQAQVPERTARPHRGAANLFLAACCVACLTGCADSLGNAPDNPTALANVSAGAPPTDAEMARTAASFTAAATPGNAGYKIGPLDVLDITVFKAPELSRSVQVAETGSINLPLVGEVSTAGRTSREVERDLTAKLGARYMNSPQVSVFVKEYNSQRVTLEGAVKKPGVYPLRGRTTLLQFVAVAEGLDRDTASSSVLVFRNTEGGGRSAARFDLDDIRAGKAEDPPMQQGDTIVVEQSRTKSTFSYILRALPVASVFRPF